MTKSQRRVAVVHEMQQITTTIQSLIDSIMGLEEFANKVGIITGEFEGDAELEELAVEMSKKLDELSEIV